MDHGRAQHSSFCIRAAGAALLVLTRVASAQEPVPDDETQRAAADASAATREWFGAKSWHYWEHATGDWSGWRDALSSHGLAFQSTWTGELTRIFSGGVERASTFHHLFDVNFTFDPEPLFGWPGAAFYVDAYALNGRQTSEDAGDFQSFSNIDAEPVQQVAEVWWEQRLFDGALRVKLGKVDASTEFTAVENTSEFLHSGLSYSITSGIPLYPDPATSGNLFVTPCQCFTLGVGCYDGAAQEGVHTGRLGPATFFGPPADLYWISEATLRWHVAASELPGRLGLGASLHTGTLDRFDGNRQRHARTWYATADQTFWREHSDQADDVQGVGASLLYGEADDDVSAAARHVALGVQWTGPIEGRDADVVGLGASWLEFARDAGFTERHELALELVYRVQATAAIAVKPDVQCIINPGGDATIHDAWVGALRIEVAF